MGIQAGQILVPSRRTAVFTVLANPDGAPGKGGAVATSPPAATTDARLRPQIAHPNDHGTPSQIRLLQPSRPTGGRFQTKPVVSRWRFILAGRPTSSQMSSSRRNPKPLARPRRLASIPFSVARLSVTDADLWATPYFFGSASERGKKCQL